MNEKLIPYEYNHAEPHEWSIRRIGELLKSERYEVDYVKIFHIGHFVLHREFLIDSQQDDPFPVTP